MEAQHASRVAELAHFEHLSPISLASHGVAREIQLSPQVASDQQRALILSASVAVSCDFTGEIDVRSEADAQPER